MQKVYTPRQDESLRELRRLSSLSQTIMADLVTCREDQTTSFDNYLAESGLFVRYVL